MERNQMKERIPLSKFYFGPGCGRRIPHYYYYKGRWMREYKGKTQQVIGLELERLLNLYK